MTNFEKVRLFMKTYGQEVKEKAGFSDTKTNKLRIDLIKEELEELTEAMQDENLLEVADALTDILYVTYGACLLYTSPSPRDSLSSRMPSSA